MQPCIVISNREPERFRPARTSEGLSGKAEVRNTNLPEHGRVNPCRGTPVPGGSRMPWQRRLRDISPLSRLLPFVNIRYPAVADALGLNHRDLLWRALPQHLLHTEYLLLLCLQQLCPALAATSRSRPRDGECGCCTHRGRGSQAICNAPALQETGKWLKAPPGAMKPPGFSRERGQAGGGAGWGDGGRRASFTAMVSHDKVLPRCSRCCNRQAVCPPSLPPL